MRVCFPRRRSESWRYGSGRFTVRLYALRCPSMTAPKSPEAPSSARPGYLPDRGCWTHGSDQASGISPDYGKFGGSTMELPGFKWSWTLSANRFHRALLAIVVLLPAPLFSGGDSLTAEIGGDARARTWKVSRCNGIRSLPRTYRNPHAKWCVCPIPPHLHKLVDLRGIEPLSCIVRHQLRTCLIGALPPSTIRFKSGNYLLPAAT